MLLSPTGFVRGRAIEWAWLGRLPYARALALQERVHADVLAGRAPETLLLLEHDPVITLGRHADAAHVLTGAEALGRAGITVLQDFAGWRRHLPRPGPVGRLSHLPPAPRNQGPRRRDGRRGRRRACRAWASRRRGAVATRSLGRRRQDLRRGRAGSPARHHARLRAQRERRSRRLSRTSFPAGCASAGVTSIAGCAGTAPALPALAERLAAAFARSFAIRHGEDSICALHDCKSQTEICKIDSSS